MVNKAFEEGNHTTKIYGGCQRVNRWKRVISLIQFTCILKIFLMKSYRKR